jgi:hypothetical protein
MDPYPFHDHFLDLDPRTDPDMDPETDLELDPKKDPETDWELEPDSWQSALRIAYHTGGHTGAPCVVNKIFILDLLFLGAFCLSYKFIFLKSTFNSASFDTHKPHIVKKNLGPQYSACPKIS